MDESDRFRRCATEAQREEFELLFCLLVGVANVIDSECAFFPELRGLVFGDEYEPGSNKGSRGTVRLDDCFSGDLGDNVALLAPVELDAQSWFI